ncbi:hypothetical protein BDV98DRAFT_608869 [Pterulicium gracile]|uniref:DUF6534 domain-containing protein n=1 Tax=Pterulicium gracile TaxID=1884261 RepID=A0A5C3Q086_9AGAR|nr:hypothetical protein BDV98DRAFT_608869 [Pterula gracilis]
MSHNGAPLLSIHRGSTIGSMVTGCLFSAVLHGMTVMQLISYLRRYFLRDPLYLQLTLAAVMCAETVHAAIVIHFLYRVTVTNFGNVGSLFQVEWDSALSIAFPLTISAILQGFYSYRISVLSRRWIFTILGFAGVLARIATGIVLVVNGMKLGSQIPEFLSKWKALLTTHLAISLVMEVFVTVCLCILTRSDFAMFSRSRTVSDYLVIWFIEAGILSCICAAATLISFLASKRSFIWFIFTVASSRIKAQSLLASLNGRSASGRCSGILSPDVSRTGGNHESARRRDSPQVYPHSHDALVEVRIGIQSETDGPRHGGSVSVSSTFSVSDGPFAMHTVSGSKMGDDLKN